MSAIDLLVRGCTFCDLKRGKRVVASPFLYGGTHHLLEMLHRNKHIKVTWVDNPFALHSWVEAIQAGEPPACVLLEPLANPTIDMFDIECIALVVHQHKSWLIVDNTLSPGLLNPLEFGADATVYSVTKALNRKSSEMGGAIVASQKFRKEVEQVLDDLFVHTGIIMHPSAALAAYNNTVTLRRDMELFSKNALAVATLLSEHPKIKKVNYPHLHNSPHKTLALKQMPLGAGGVLSFELRSFDEAARFVEEQTEAYLAVHLGDGNHHLITHPASTTHSKLSLDELRKLHITPELVRLSVSLTDDMRPLTHNFLQVLDSL